MIPWSFFVENNKDAPQLTCKGEIWSLFSEFEVKFML